MASRDRDYQTNGTGRERDLVVAPNEYAYVSDQTKGNVNVHVGPLKTSLAGTDQLVKFDNRTKRFVNVDLQNAIQTFATAPEGWYLVLKNPAENDLQPQGGKADDLRGGLRVGRKVNIPGPASFALWPGQMVRTIKGHILRSNQYLLVRVYDEEGAKTNWNKAVIKRADGEEGTADEVLKTPDITMGKLFVIKGTEVSFYIPPTGVEVVRDENDENVRDALTLERLEYGILKDENGGKRYLKGPDVVFPEPTEVFVEKGKTRKFKAIELSPISGLYIKVIADYDDHKVGDELFITGKQQMIYFPREEHAIMKYGDEHIHFATAIPAGEGRYVLNRLSGEISLKLGPSMYLPDPRTEVLVRRVIDPKQVSIWFPGNTEAIEYNASMAQMQESPSQAYVSDKKLKKMMRGKSSERLFAADAGPERGWDTERTGRSMIDDSFDRKETYTKPRTLTLNTKFEGAVMIEPWTGYAIKVVSKTGKREVIVGPTTYLLEYDEVLEHMELSTGTPKSDDKLLKTSYLRVLNNKVSDVITAVTKDSCKVKIALSYRVNFTGDKEKWFDVENFIKFLTDHMRSLGRAVIKSKGIEDFYKDPHTIIRDAFLGKQDENGNRQGRLFEENGMKIYEIEVLGIQIGDAEIEGMLVRNQNEVVKQSLELERSKREMELTKSKEEMKRSLLAHTVKTNLATVDGNLKILEKQKEADLAGAAKELAIKEADTLIEKEDQKALDVANDAKVARDKAIEDQKLEVDAKKLELTIQELQEEAKAVAEKGKAITPQFIHALQAFADKELAGKLAESMGPLSIIGGESIVDVFAKLLRGTKLEKIGTKLFTNGLHDEEDWSTKQSM
jgi:major vault protein